MIDQNDIYILDSRDKKALEARLMELSDLFWDLFEQKRLAPFQPAEVAPMRIPALPVTAATQHNKEIPTY
jgi:hypothetical protein